MKNVFEFNESVFYNKKNEFIEQLKQVDTKKIIKKGRDVGQHTFIFDKSWDMEQCLSPVHFNDSIDWHYSYKNDPEWMYMLNRQNYLVDLAESFVLTNDSKYLNGIEEILTSWLDQEGASKGNEQTTWRTLDVGLRIKNWIKTLDILSINQNEHINQRLLKRLVNSINEQIQYLFEEYDDSKVLSNWCILAFHGVYIAACFLSNSMDTKKWREQSMSILEKCAQIQIVNDGFHWEQSFMYHHEVLLCLSEVLMIQKRCNMVQSKIIKRICQKMLHASLSMTPPDGNQLAYGDGDIEKLSSIQTFVALILESKEENCNYMIENNSELLELYGALDKSALFKLNQKPNVKTDFEFGDVGNYFMRSSWTAEANYLFFKNGFMGSGHGHEDLLHFELFLKGKPILIDSGRYTYKGNDVYRQMLKAAPAHNTITIDQKEFTVQKSAWNVLKVANEVKRPSYFSGSVSSVQGINLGYSPQTVINRRIVYLKPDVFIVLDEIITKTKHTVQRYLNFASDIKVVQSQYQLIGKKSNEELISINLLDKANIILSEEMASPNYNTLKAHQRVTLKNEVYENSILPMVISPAKDNLNIQKVNVYDMSRTLMSNKSTLALKLSKNDESWILLVNSFEPNNGRKLQIVNHIGVFGRVVVIHEKNGTKTTKTLEY